MTNHRAANVGYRFFDLVGMLFVAVLLISNTVGTKIIQIGPLSLPGGVIVFPIAYVFGDVLTEVYGYSASRRIIWMGLLMNALMAGAYALVGVIPAAPFWMNQTAYNQVLGQVPRIVGASMLAYFAGEFCNSYVLAKMKIVTNGRYLWSRTIGSTAVGEAVDTVVFCLVAFVGTMPTTAISAIVLSNYAFKVVYEIVATPLTYGIVGFLKRAENEDYFDVSTNFNPFLLRDSAFERTSRSAHSN